MEDPESLLSALGITEASSVPDDVWNRAVENATDPNAPTVDAGLVPDMTDEPVAPDDDALIYGTGDFSEGATGDTGGGNDSTDDGMSAGDDVSVFLDSDGTDERVHDVGAVIDEPDTPGSHDITF